MTNTAVTTTALSRTETAVAASGPSFAAALCGFLSTTVATTMLLVLLGTL